MTHRPQGSQGSFDKDFWEGRWAPDSTGGPASMSENPPHPYLAAELRDLGPGAALDAGCGAGAEAVWLAERGWRVTAADISSEALRRAAARIEHAGLSDRVELVEADLGTWSPAVGFDLVTTHYAHPSMPQLDFYERLAGWVAPGGTLLVVGHLSAHGGPDHGDHGGHGDHGDHRPPAEASATAAAVTARLDDRWWEVVTAVEVDRTLPGRGGRTTTLHDVVVRATRRSGEPSSY